MRIKISNPFIISCGVLYIIGTDALFLASIMSAFIHELGHVMCIYLTGNKIKSIYIGVLGGLIETKGSSYKQDILISLAGCFLNFLTVLIISVLNMFISLQEFFFLFSGSSFILGVFNLLPVISLDGGNAIYSAICIYSDNIKAEKALCKFSLFFSIIIIILGIYVIFRTKYNFTIALIGVFLIFTLQKHFKNKKTMIQ